MTGNNNELTVYLDDSTSERLLMYQESEGVSKSKAGAQMINAGLQAEFGGLTESFFMELAKAAVAIALTLTFVWWFTGVGQFYTYMFYGMAIGSLVIHYSNFNPLAVFSKREHGA